MFGDGVADRLLLKGERQPRVANDARFSTRRTFPWARRSFLKQLLISFRLGFASGSAAPTASMEGAMKFRDFSFHIWTMVINAWPVWRFDPAFECLN
jgi:hypothetical protein